MSTLLNAIVLKLILFLNSWKHVYNYTECIIQNALLSFQRKRIMEKSTVKKLKTYLFDFNADHLTLNRHCHEYHGYYSENSKISVTRSLHVSDNRQPKYRLSFAWRLRNDDRHTKARNVVRMRVKVRLSLEPTVWNAMQICWSKEETNWSRSRGISGSGWTKE